MRDIVIDKVIIEDGSKWVFEFNFEVYRKKYSQRMYFIDFKGGVQWLILVLLVGNLDNIREKVKLFCIGVFNQ